MDGRVALHPVQSAASDLVNIPSSKATSAYSAHHFPNSAISSIFFFPSMYDDYVTAMTQHTAIG
jgi:hypothetical protein